MSSGHRIKARDVALVANVSVSAVSRAFTPGASVSAETRTRIMAAADTLGYRPNIIARGLTTRRTQLVGVVMQRRDSPFFERFMSLLNEDLAAEGQKMLLLLIGSRAEADEAVQQAMDYSVGGLIFVSSAPSRSAALAASRAQVPIVVLDRDEGAMHCSRVWTDGASIARQVADVFIAEGRRRAVAVSFLTGQPQPRELDHFLRMMEEATGRPTPLIETGALYDDGVAAARALFSGPSPPDAIFAATDVLAVGVHDAARYGMGIDVPRDLSIIGLGDTQPAAWMSHAITSIKPPLEVLVKTAVETLIAQINDLSLPSTNTAIHCQLIRRDTTLPP